MTHYGYAIEHEDYSADGDTWAVYEVGAQQGEPYRVFLTSFPSQAEAEDMVADLLRRSQVGSA